MPTLRSWWVVLVIAGCDFRGGGAIAIDAPVASDDAVDAAADARPDATPGSWWNDAWKRRNLVTVHANELDATLAGYPLAGFPALVTLAPQLIDYAMVKPDGADLRFVLESDDTTVVPYQLDTWSYNGTSRIWVRLPSLGATSDVRLWLYHANPGAPPVSDGAAVFAADYVSVHHLDDGPEDYDDATGHNHLGRTPGGDPGATSAAVGEGRAFDGVDDYITLDGEASYDFTTTLAVSAWIRVQAFTVDYQAIVVKGDLTWRMHRQENTSFIGFGTSSGGNDNHNGNVAVTTNTWRHVAIVYDGAAKRIYVDGVLDQADSYNETIDTDNAAVAFGRNENSQTGGPRLWLGGMDEIRISQQPRSAAWIGAEHRMVTNAQLVTVGADEMR